MTAACQLLDRQAHVWYARPEQFDRQTDRYQALLSEEERQKYGQFRFAKDRLCYLAAHALLRLSLSRYASVEPHAWLFSAKAGGRPELHGEHASFGLRFNLSHTDGLVVCVIARHTCGIDVEFTQRPLHGLDFNQYLTETEAAALMSAGQGTRTERMLAFWTLKEAYAKARGLGLALPLKKFWFNDIFSDDDIRITVAPDIDDQQGDWQFMLDKPLPTHCCAVAIQTGSSSQPAIIIRPAELG